MKIGDKILVDDKIPATICYIGSVDNHPGQWIGIEYWNQQGKHNGIYQGKTYFQTKFQRQTGAFIRPERISFGHSFTEAIYRQYIKSFSNETLRNDIDYSLFGKQYSDYVLELSSLVRIDLSIQWTNQFDDNQRIYENLQQIEELNIRQNLIENWSQISSILDKYFARLKILNVSNSRIDFDLNSTKRFDSIEELVLIDVDYDCDTFQELIPFFPNLNQIHLDLNRLTFISTQFVDQLQNLTKISLSDNPNLKSWNPSINNLGKLKYLEELIANNCGIEQIQLSSEQDFPSLKYLYLSDNQISSFYSINQLSNLRSLISLGILRNPIYPSNQQESETAKQMIIAHLPNLTHLNRVLINRDERRGAEIDYLQKYAKDYFENRLDFINEHRQYLKLIEKYGEPMKTDSNELSKKGLCIRSNLLKISFELADENNQRIEKKIPTSMTIAKLKTFVKKLFSSKISINSQINLFILIDENHKELLGDDYQDIHFYIDTCFNNNQNTDQTSVIRIETVN